MALAFVLSHRAVTAAILGPRTLDQLEGLIGAHEITLDSEVLDRIDEIVEPGATINKSNLGWVPPALVDNGLRRK